MSSILERPLRRQITKAGKNADISSKRARTDAKPAGQSLRLFPSVVTIVLTAMVALSVSLGGLYLTELLVSSFVIIALVFFRSNSISHK